MNHSEIQDLIPLLALGGLSQQEQARLEQHLAVCPSCRALLAEYTFIGQELAAQVPQVEAHARIETELLQRIAVPAERAQLELGERAQPARKPNFWRQPVSLARWAFAVGVLALLLLVGATVALALQVQRAGDVNAAAVAQLLGARERKFVELTGAGGGEGYLVLAPDNPAALLWLYNLQPLDYDHVYQVWLKSDRERVSGGLFRPDHDGRAVVLVNAPDALREYKEIGITVEPAAGSARPTTPRVMGGRLD